MRRHIVALAAIAIACGGASTSAPRALDPTKPSPSAQQRFHEALAAFEAHEKTRDWTRESCVEVAGRFDASGFAIASYDAGIVFERCRDHASALDRLRRALAADPSLMRAKVEIALEEYRASRDRDRAITELDRVVREEKFQDANALVALATLQDDRSGPGDADAARANFERALAVDDQSMPAYDALARHHYARARKTDAHPRDTIQLELAELIVSQATQKNASYAPLYNTSGLIESELGHPHLASRAFERAAQIDPTLFEAHMNLGELNLAYRGFGLAEASFRRAIALAPNDYDAHLGLALALRGQISGIATPAQLAGVRDELRRCMALDGSRLDALFNEAILTQEFEAKTASNSTDAIAAYDRAIAELVSFKARAASDARYARASKLADAHVEDMTRTRDFLK